MLTLIALFFLYIDIYMSSVDLIADSIGFFLLVIDFLLLWRQKKCSVLWAPLAFVAALAAALPWLFLDSYAVDLVSWLVPAVAAFFLVRRRFVLACEKAQSAYRFPPDPDRVVYEQNLVRLCLLLILLCELCTLILGQITVFAYILWILRTIAGIVVIVRTYKMLYWNVY
jgi:hypothetical protein